MDWFENIMNNLFYIHLHLRKSDVTNNGIFSHFVQFFASENPPVDETCIELK